MAALTRQYAKDYLHITDLPYRFSSWALDEPENTRLWFDENQELVAWAVMQTPFWTVDYGINAKLTGSLLPEVFSWADKRAQTSLHSAYGHPAWFIMEFADQAERIRELERFGFADQSNVVEDPWSKVLFRRPASLPITPVKSKAGFTIRPLEKDEVQKYVELHRSVFESKNMTLEWRTRTLEHPDYRPELDLVIESPSKELVAFCVCWFDKYRMTGQIEPLGCREDFRRQGLAQLVLSEGIQRLQSLGVKDIFVETDNFRNAAFQFYQDFGFEISKDVLVFRKDYNDD
jgi:ribosomal protein S18 acetylase RimI-like enzyme